LAVTITGDPMANVANATQFLGVKVHELAGARPFIPLHERAGADGLELPEPELPQRPPDGGATDAHDLGDLLARPLQLPQALDFHHDCRRNRARRAMRPARAIRQLALRRSERPLPGRPITHQEIPRDDRHRLAAGDATRDYRSTVRQGPGILVDVHPGRLLRVDGRWETTTFAETSRLDNLLSPHS
jgi:hypothetical protein